MVDERQLARPELGVAEDWLGFPAVRPIPGLDVLLVPLLGHTLGHAGIAVPRGDRWLLAAGDAYFFHREMAVAHPACERQPDVDVFCSHDVVEFERLSGRSAEVPADRLTVSAATAG